jgi:hypothetical protein
MVAPRFSRQSCRSRADLPLNDPVQISRPPLFGLADDFGPVYGDQPATRGGEAEGNGAPDPLRRAGDDREPCLQNARQEPPWRSGERARFIDQLASLRGWAVVPLTAHFSV